MTPAFIERLVETLSTTSIVQFEYDQALSSVRLRFDRSVMSVPGRPFPPAPAQSSGPGSRSCVVADGIGILRLAHPQRGGSFVATGSTVQKGQVVAFLQVDELLREVITLSAGVLGEALALDGSVIGFGQPLFELRL